MLLTPPLFHPKFGVFPLHQVAHVGTNVSRDLKLFGHEIFFEVVVVDALFVVTNFGGTMNNVSPTFSIPDHLQYFVYRQVGPVCNVVDPGTWWSSSASAAWDTACDDVLF